MSQVASQPRPSLSPERSLRSPRTRTLSLLPRALSPTVSYLSLPLREVSIVGLTLSRRALSPPLSLPLSIVELHWQASLAAVTAMATLADVCPHH